MIPVEKRTISDKKYIMYLPNDKGNTLEVRFRFNNNKEFNMKNNEVLIELSKDMQEKDILDAIKNSVNEIVNRGYKTKKLMTFEVSNVDEAKIVDGIIDLGFKDVIDVDKNKEYYEEIFNVYLTTKSIMKMDNGRIVNYVIAHEDSNSREFVLAGIDVNKMEQAFLEIVGDENKRSILEGKSPLDTANIVLNYIADRDNLKRYMLGENSNTDVDSRVGNMTQNVATKDDKINTELGIIKNDVKDRESMSYQTISIDGDDVRVAGVNPGTISANASSNGNSSYNNGGEVSSYVEEEYADGYNNYYIDNDGNLYDNNENLLCNINSSREYKIDVNDNSVYYNDKKVGVVDDYRTLGTSQEKKQENVLKRVLVPNSNSDNKGIIKMSIMGLLLGIFIMIMMYLIVR
jgi:hypothetical protein